MNTEARTNAITGSVTVTVNEAAGQAAIERAKALLAGIQGGVDKAMKASMSRTVDRLRRESNQAIREKYDITDAGIRAEKKRAGPIQLPERRAGHRHLLRAEDTAVPFRAAHTPKFRRRTSRRGRSRSW